MKAIFKHFPRLAFVQVNMRKSRKRKTVEHCASSPAEPVLDFCLYLLCKKESPCTYDLRMHLSCIIVQYVCACVSQSNKLTWSNISVILLFLLPAENSRLGWVPQSKSRCFVLFLGLMWCVCF